MQPRRRRLLDNANGWLGCTVWAYARLDDFGAAGDRATWPLYDMLVLQTGGDMVAPRVGRRKRATGDKVLVQSSNRQPGDRQLPAGLRGRDVDASKSLAGHTW